MSSSFKTSFLRLQFQLFTKFSFFFN